jgi:hypothetical protein
MPKRTTEAQAEITQFLNSGEAGMVTDYSKPQLWRAAESLFTSRGLACPVRIETINGTTVLINRDIYDSNTSTGSSTSGNE